MDARFYRAYRVDRRLHYRIASLPAGLVLGEKEPERRPLSAAAAWCIASLGMVMSTALTVALVRFYAPQVCS